MIISARITIWESESWKKVQVFTHSLILGIIIIVSGFISITGSEHAIFHYEYYSMKNISYFVKVYGGSKDPGFSYFFDYVSFHGFIWTIVVLSVISMISNCLMLYGIRKKIPGFLIAWLSINMILLIVSTYNYKE